MVQCLRIAERWFLSSRVFPDYSRRSTPFAARCGRVGAGSRFAFAHQKAGVVGKRRYDSCYVGLNLLKDFVYQFVCYRPGLHPIARRFGTEGNKWAGLLKQARCPGITTAFLSCCPVRFAEV